MDHTNPNHETRRGVVDNGSPPAHAGRPTPTATAKSTIAEVLDVVAGLMSLIGAFVLFLIGMVGTGAITTAGAHDATAARLAFLPIAFFGPLALLCLVIGVVAIVGGVAAVRRRRFWLALVGCIAALFSFFPLGTPAVVLTLMAEREFH